MTPYDKPKISGRGMEKMTKHTIGVDISKETLDAYRHGDKASKQFHNTVAGHAELIRWVGSSCERLVFEPTRPYHRALEQALAEAGVPLVKVNPRQARKFAEATGELAKTDKADAAMLARMGVALELEPRASNSEQINELKELHISRAALIKDRTVAKNREKTLRNPLLKQQNADRLAHIQQQLDALDREIASRIKAGKPAKVAIVAVMRKLIVLANALLKKGTHWRDFRACS